MRLRPWLLLGIAGLLVRGFYDVGILHGEYRIAYGTGVSNIHPNELMFYLWYLLFGTGAAAALTASLAGTALPDRIERHARALIGRPRLLLGVAVPLLLGLVLLAWHLVLEQAPIADDEGTYVFIARTLLGGRVTNPSPGDVEFFRNKFVILDSAGWYGKYPIGHPALLALGDAIGLRFLAMPVLSCVSLLLTFVIGRRIFGSLIGGVAVLLLLISPQLVLTSATQLSQPTSMFAMLLGLWAMLRLDADPRARWALLGGAAWGFGVLVRPLPGGLFLFAAALAYLLATRTRERRSQWRRRLALLAVAAIPVALFGAAFAWVNLQQTGAAAQTGYQVAHANQGILANHDGQLSVSVGGALLRQSFWLFGWPLSLLFVPFARGRRAMGLFWGLIAAEYAYRALVPKTVVATTGPIYVMEIVPLLALATAAGMVQIKRRLERIGVQSARRWVVAAVIASTCVALVTFVPVQLANIRRGGEAWNRPFRMLARAGAKRALVFAFQIVPGNLGDSWAYSPPNPSPSLDDDIIFVRPPAPPNTKQKAISLWQRRFPDRSAWLFFYDKKVARMIQLRR